MVLFNLIFRRAVHHIIPVYKVKINSVGVAVGGMRSEYRDIGYLIHNPFLAYTVDLLYRAPVCRNLRCAAYILCLEDFLALFFNTRRIPVKVRKPCLNQFVINFHTFGIFFHNFLDSLCICFRDSFWPLCHEEDDTLPSCKVGEMLLTIFCIVKPCHGRLISLRHHIMHNADASNHIIQRVAHAHMILWKIFK